MGRVGHGVSQVFGMILKTRDIECPSLDLVEKLTHSRARVTPQNIQLAPAAGVGIGKLIADALLSDPDFIPRMKEAFMGALVAEIHFFDKAGGGWQSRPDYRIRLQAVMGCLAHMEGEPVKRIIHQHLGGTGEIDPLAAMQDSPALREAVERTLAKAKWRESGRRGNGKNAKPVEPASMDID